MVVVVVPVAVVQVGIVRMRVRELGVMMRV